MGVALVGGRPGNGFRREVRSFILGVIASTIVLLVSIAAGTTDPKDLVIRVLFALIVIWLVFEIV